MSAITKPLWAQSLPIMMEFVNQKRYHGQAVVKAVTPEDSLKRLYEVFGGSLAKASGKGIDLNTSLILSYYEVEDYHLYTSLAILIAYMFALKILTYFVLLAKLHSTK